MPAKQTGVIVEEAGSVHLAAILALYQAAGITGAKAYDLEQAQQQFEKISRYPFYRIYVAKIDGQVVGTYEFILIDNLAKAGLKTAIVEDVAVSPAYQNQGIGKAMMVHAQQVAKDNGAYKLALSSNDKRQDAHAFYEALGFERHGVSFRVDL